MVPTAITSPFTSLLRSLHTRRIQRHSMAVNRATCTVSMQISTNTAIMTMHLRISYMESATVRHTERTMLQTCTRSIVNMVTWTSPRLITSLSLFLKDIAFMTIIAAIAMASMTNITTGSNLNITLAKSIIRLIGQVMCTCLRECLRSFIRSISETCLLHTKSIKISTKI